MKQTLESSTTKRAMMAPLLPSMPAMPRLTVVMQTSRRLTTSAFLTKMQVTDDVMRPGETDVSFRHNDVVEARARRTEADEVLGVDDGVGAVWRERDPDRLDELVVPEPVALRDLVGHLVVRPLGLAKEEGL
jgi:hypothetical protein